ncbi:diguanylate cyclase domain-containing protein [Posidoniimonas polymericola]|uniref:diguanylate cyclase domain-containing protein n=1 Tax=Posidoniimonas polymericola TaxID=2528002 RepID=UPI0018D2BF5F|nr:diguanylate cyclase [Posidoniimonas polymericola]
MLLQSLEETARLSGHAAAELDPKVTQFEDRLAAARLGLAGSLFTGLRCKHPPTASHCLRVALGCSRWAAALEMPDALRTQLELAALLHDIGKLGVPDSVLIKQGRLQPEDLAALNRAPYQAKEILERAGAPQKLIDVVIASNAWYDGSRGDSQPSGEDIPVLARFLSIVDAYDSMTTDHVYRPAKSQERAVAELFQCAGSQFDPGLVRSFVEQLGKNYAERSAEVSQRWLAQLDTGSGNLPWEFTSHAPSGADPASSELAMFEKELIDHMHDGVVFVSPHRQILLWNTGAERMTGVGSSAAVGQTLTPSLLVMSASDGRLLDDTECPIAEAINTGAPNVQRMSVIGRKGKHIEVDLHSIPVCSPSQGILGATVLLHDASSEASLEQRCQALHVEMTKDPMTQVANRAEFDRALAMFVDAHQETGLPCSLIMADIDHFKSINDTFGHQAGDEAIISFATLLKAVCRTGDLVARYGGEEFAVLCADCNNANAAMRAEQMRRALSETVQSELGGKSITASFGVSELQAGDTPETLLRRSDRALLQAKDQGRNQVVQLGAGMDEEQPKKSWWGFGSWGKSLIETTLVTNVPIEVAVEKLKGFIADHDAKILKTAEHEIRIECSDAGAGSLRRTGDRPVGFVLDLKLEEEFIERENSVGLAKGAYAQTTAAVTIRPRHERDRRRGYATERARKLLGSLRSYLMAREADLETSPSK